MESFIKLKTNRKTIFTKTEESYKALNETFLQETPIYWAIKNFFALQILQPVSVVREYFRDFERSNPEGIKLVMFAFVLPGHIPLKHQISQLEIFLYDLPVKGLLDFLLITASSIHYLLLGLLRFHQLMNFSDHMI
jgi:hypothetical protein